MHFLSLITLPISLIHFLSLYPASFQATSPFHFSTFSILKASSLSLSRRNPQYHTQPELPHIIAWRTTQPRRAAHQYQTTCMRFCTLHKPILLFSFLENHHTYTYILFLAPNLSNITIIAFLNSSYFLINPTIPYSKPQYDHTHSNKKSMTIIHYTILYGHWRLSSPLYSPNLASKPSNRTQPRSRRRAGTHRCQATQTKTRTYAHL